MIYKYEIENTDGQGLFTGSVSIKMPRPSERLRLMSKLNLTKMTGENGETLEANTDKAESAANLYEFVESSIESVDLNHKDAGDIKTLDDLLMLNDCFELLSKLGTVLINGVQVGKPSEV